MKATYNWLKDYLDINFSPRDLAEKLTMAGLEVTSLEKTSRDWVMDFEITTNRPDWLSIIGIAREAGAVIDKPITFPPVSLQESQQNFQIEVTISDSQSCPRYRARLINGIQLNSTPEWMKDRIEAVGLRSVNLIVDITNFVLMEYGQPLHAFDYDKLAGGKIIVRRAKKGEKLLTINGKLVELDPEILVIADQDKPVAIAGVVGGKSSEVDENTKRVLLESAYFDPIAIRKSAKKLTVSTESSYRFERKVDPEGIVEASNRACHLLQELAGGKVDRVIEDIGRKDYQQRKIYLSASKVNSILGVDISIDEISSMLKRLGLGTRNKANRSIEVEIPSFRQDLIRPIDLVEEIARLYGYQNIPAATPRIRIASCREDSRRTCELQVKQTLVSVGLKEVINYSLISRELLPKIKMKDEKVVSISNPLSREQEMMRPTLLPGILNTISWNKNRKINNIRIFELSRIYLPGILGGSPVERLNLSVALYGKKAPNWKEKERNLDFYDLKGIVEACLECLGIDDYKIVEKKYPVLDSINSAGLKVKDTVIGYLGQIDQEVLANFDLDETVYIFECDFDKLISYSQLKKRYKPFIKYPSVSYDIALIVKENISSQQIASLINSTAGELARKIKLFDVYRGKQIPDGHKSLAYSIEYQAADRTLTAKEVEELHSRVRRILEDKLGAQIR